MTFISYGVINKYFLLTIDFKKMICVSEMILKLMSWLLCQVVLVQYR